MDSYSGTANARLRRLAGTLGIFLAATLFAASGFSADAFAEARVPHYEYTLELLSSRATVEAITMSPDGEMSAVLLSRADAAQDTYHVEVVVLNNQGPAQPTRVASYTLHADDLYKTPYLNLRPTAGGVAWSPDSRSLLYISPAHGNAELKVWNRASGRSKAVLGGHAQVALADSRRGSTVKVLTFDPDISRESRTPPDRALLMRDGYRFYGDLRNPEASPMMEEREWTFDWPSKSVRRGKRRSVHSVDPPRDFPIAARGNGALRGGIETGEEILAEEPYTSPGGVAVASVEYGEGALSSPSSGYAFNRLVMVNGETRTVVTKNEGIKCRTIPIGWDAAGRNFYFVEQCHDFSNVRSTDVHGKSGLVYTSSSQLASWRLSPNFGFDPRKRIAVFGRSSTFHPGDIIEVDLKSGATHILLDQNRQFRKLPRFRTINLVAEDSVFESRLYLPESTTNPPLVVALYYSTPGFEISTGDEIPILALVERGIAVMTVDAGKAGIAPTNGGAPWEIARVERPRVAIEDLVGQAAKGYGIDISRVGLVGLSYGSEIAMYAYWKSHAFRAVSSAGGSWSPAELLYGGVGYAANVAPRGFTDAYDPIDPIWHELSAAMNVRPDLPPLLWQSPDDDRYASVESWYRLRKGGAQVEWLEYPNESHIKRGPANKYFVYSRNLDWFRFWLQDYEDQQPGKRGQYERWRAMKSAWVAAVSGLRPPS